MAGENKIQVYVLCCNGEPIGVYTTRDLLEYSKALHQSSNADFDDYVFVSMETDRSPRYYMRSKL